VSRAAAASSNAASASPHCSSFESWIPRSAAARPRAVASSAAGEGASCAEATPPPHADDAATHRATSATASRDPFTRVEVRARRRPCQRAQRCDTFDAAVSDEETRGSVPQGTLVGGRFRVERLIGRGGMGEVYAARHATTGKEVALKLIHAAVGSGNDAVRRFMREARAATAIQHPNVIDVFDVFEDSDGTPVMVMELLKGEPFSAYRERAGALQLHEVAELLLPATQALRAAHEKGIVHRDLKPDNVFLVTTPTGRTTKLLDFGIAKVLDPTKIGSETQGQQTNTGSIIGTPHYMSYEQAMSDKQVDQRTDIWAMGVMIFEALTGRRPLTYETLGQMYANFIQGTVPSIREFLPDLPGDVVVVLDRCLAKQQEERLADLGPLIDVLTKYTDPTLPGATVGGRVLAAPVKREGNAPVTGSPLSTSVASAPGPRRSRVAWRVVALVVVVGGLGLGAVALKVRGPSSTSDASAPPKMALDSTREAAASSASDAAVPLEAAVAAGPTPLADASLGPTDASAATAASSPVKIKPPTSVPAAGSVPAHAATGAASSTKKVIQDDFQYPP